VKLIPKPEGYDLRDKRSDKSQASRDWNPQDCLYSASQAMTDETVACVVIWANRNAEGKYRVFMKTAGPDFAGPALIAEGLNMSRSGE
jgi:hypothetical protein